MHVIAWLAPAAEAWRKHMMDEWRDSAGNWNARSATPQRIGPSTPERSRSTSISESGARAPDNETRSNTMSSLATRYAPPKGNTSNCVYANCCVARRTPGPSKRHARQKLAGERLASPSREDALTMCAMPMGTKSCYFICVSNLCMLIVNTWNVPNIHILP